MATKPSKSGKKVSKPVPLGGVKRKKNSEDALWGPAKPVRKNTPMRKPKSAKEMSAAYRKKAQVGRLTAAQRRIVTQRDKDREMDTMISTIRNRSRGSR